MSVVVAIKEGNKVYIGADSQVTKGGTRTTLKNPNNYKVWKVRGADNCLMAQVGAVRDANVVRLMDRLVTDYNVYREHISYDFVVKKIVPDIISELRFYGNIKDDKYVELLDSAFIFAYRDQLYVIGLDKSVIEVEDYVAIGSGEDQAIGSLISTEGESPKERIVKAIKASAAADIYVDYPIILIDTEETKFEVVTEKDEAKYLNKMQKSEEEPKQPAQETTNDEEICYLAVKEWVLTQEFVSISRIQRECSIGFNRAGRFLLRLQNEGIVSKEMTKQGCLVIK